MPETHLDNPQQGPQLAKTAPSTVCQLWMLAKVTFGVALVMCGCWRLSVWAFGPDESLFFAFKVKAKSAKEQAEFWKQYSTKVRELRKSDEDPALPNRSNNSIANYCGRPRSRPSVAVAANSGFAHDLPGVVDPVSIGGNRARLGQRSEIAAAIPPSSAFPTPWKTEKR
jgi:hypothetical protein